MYAMVLKSVGAALERTELVDQHLAAQIDIIPETTPYPLSQANQALADLRAGRFEGAAVLVP